MDMKIKFSNGLWGNMNKKTIVFTCSIILFLSILFVIFNTRKNITSISHMISTGTSSDMIPANKNFTTIPVSSNLFMAFDISIKVLETIENKDYISFSKYIHKEKGVIFVPFSYIDYDVNLVFSPAMVKTFAEDNTIYDWGIYDQSPERIKLSVDDYFDQFVYDKKYIDTRTVSINYTIRRGNSIENIEEVFENCIYIDFYDGGSEECEGLDWSSLKIVMEKYNDTYEVVAVIHSCYTM